MESNELQGTEEWFQERSGKITSSKFDVLKTKGTKIGRFGAGALTYAYELISDDLEAEREEGYDGANTQYGTETESVAIDRYETRTFTKVEKCGFIPYGSRAGGSPDGLVGEDGIIEVKCRVATHIHTAVLVTKEVPASNYYQCQGNLLVTGRKWCDFISYCENMKDEKQQLVVVRVYRDEPLLDQLKKDIYDFSKEIDLLIEKI